MQLVGHPVGTMKLIKNLPRDLVKRNTLARAKTARVFNRPVVLTSSQEILFQGLFLFELANMFPKEYNVRVKRAGIVNAQDEPSFVAAVKNTGRETLIMAGVTSDVCPAIRAVKAGYGVRAVLDAGAHRLSSAKRWRVGAWSVKGSF